MNETAPPGPEELGATQEPHDTSEEGPRGGPGFGQGGPLRRLLDGDADGPPVPSLMSDYGLSNRPLAIACRGCVRVGTGSGVPPLAEILIGGALLFLAQQQSENDGGEDRDDGEAFVPDEMDP